MAVKANMIYYVPVGSNNPAAGVGFQKISDFADRAPTARNNRIEYVSGSYALTHYPFGCPEAKQYSSSHGLDVHRRIVA